MEKLTYWRQYSSCVKGNHFFRNGEAGNTFHCVREAHHTRSEVVIVVKLNHYDSVIGHALDCLVAVLSPLLDNHIIVSIMGAVTGPQRCSPDGIWFVYCMIMFITVLRSDTCHCAKKRLKSL